MPLHPVALTRGPSLVPTARRPTTCSHSTPELSFVLHRLYFWAAKRLIVTALVSFLPLLPEFFDISSTFMCILSAEHNFCGIYYQFCYDNFAQNANFYFVEMG